MKKRQRHLGILKVPQNLGKILFVSSFARERILTKKYLPIIHLIEVYITERERTCQVGLDVKIYVIEILKIRGA